MGKLQSDNPTDSNLLDIPPQIPPRLKKKLGGPPLPEKPLHIRAKQILPSSHQNPPREPLKPRNPDGREILVAGPKERPIERRQREPAKLLTPTNLHPSTKNRQRDCPDIVQKSTTTYQKSRRPVLLIPRNLMNSWGPITYALWMQRDSVRNHSSETSGTSVVRSGSSVTRSGSLTSQGSSGSDSGDETFPKSVLKKHHHKLEDPPKKIVTFNAFATVQLVDE